MLQLVEGAQVQQDRGAEERGQQRQRAARARRGQAAAGAATSRRAAGRGRYFPPRSARALASAASARTEKPGVCAYSSVATDGNGVAAAFMAAS